MKSILWLLYFYNTFIGIINCNNFVFLLILTIILLYLLIILLLWLNVLLIIDLLPCLFIPFIILLNYVFF